MSSYLSLSTGTARVVIERICLLLPMISLSILSSRRDERTEPPADDERSPELLSDRERVLRVLDEHGKRVWQADVATYTGWSDSKVSRVLSEMEASGEILRFWVGRRKVVCLSEAAPESASDRGEAKAVATE